VVELWAADPPRRLARGEVKVGKAAHELQDVALFGEFVLLVAERADGERPAWILRIDGERISRVATFDEAPLDWAALDAERAVFVLGTEVAVVNLASGTVERTVAWSGLLYDPAAAPPTLAIRVAAAGDTIGIVLEHDLSMALLGAGVVEGDVATRVAITFCPRSEF
jgi:hypothetical protein